MSDEFLFIGFFQLQNLCEARVPFIFIDLSTQKTQIPIVDKMLSKSIKTDLNSVLEHVGKNAPPKEVPIVLLCDDGRLSSQAAQKLAENKYLNTYVVRGGLKQLVIDAQES